MLIKGYSDFSLSNAGIRPNFIPGSCWGVYFRLDNNVSRLFPYINAVCQKSRYYHKPEYIQFIMEDVQCSLYSEEVIAAPFKGEEDALGFAQRLIDFLNGLYDKKNSLAPNYKKFIPLSPLDIYKLLPRTNCKECGFRTCMAFAATLSRNKTTPRKCPGFHPPISQNAVYPIYDKDGNLTSTITIEIDTDKDKADKQKEYIENLEKELAKANQNNPSSSEDTLSVQANLTDREIQVLRLISEGATNPEISDKLSISPHTVKSHVVHIFNKLGMNDRTQAAVWAARHRII